MVIEHVEGAVSVPVELFVRGGLEGAENESLMTSGNDSTEEEPRFHDTDGFLIEDLRN